MRRYAALALILLLALPLCAQRVQEQMLVSPDWLQRRLGMVTLLHVGDAASYEARHIPGAVLLDSSSLLVEHDGIPNEMPPIDVLERTFRDAGAGATGTIVVYGTDPLLAARAWFTLDYLGQGSRTSLLNGGLAGWMAAGYAVSAAPARPRPGTFVAHAAPQLVARLGTMRELIRLRNQLGPNLVLIDARSAAQFCGEEAGPDVARAGHIPGATNVPYEANLDAGGALRPVADLRTLYLRAGVTRNSSNIVYCRTGVQASLTYFVLRYLGYDVTLYDGSFVEWSNAGETIWS
ncbi:MAG TPA: sulfurtransferase [Thermoanaerobaculia bacterium]